MSHPRTLAQLVAARALSSAAFFVLLPFLPRWLITSDNLQPDQAGLVVGTALLMTKVGAVIAGPLASRHGPARPLRYLFAVAASVLALGGAVRVGFAGWLAIALIAGICFSNATALVKALAARHHDGSGVYLAFGYLSVAVNVAAGVGGAVAGVAAAREMSTPLIASAALVAAAVVSSGLTDGTPTHLEPRQPSQVTTRTRPRPLIPIVVGGAAVWVAYAQVFSVLPLFAERWVSPGTIGAAFLVASAILVCIQLPMTRWLGQRLDTTTTTDGSDRAVTYLGVAAAARAVSVAAIGFVDSLGPTALFTAAAVCAFAVSIWVPLLDGEVARRHRHTSLPTAYALVGLVWGAAEASGAWLGLRAVGNDGASTSAEPFFAAVSAVVAVTAAAFVIGATAIPRRTTP